jgi:hypothetical protein
MFCPAQVQGAALVSKFGCSSDLPDLLRQLWLSHIPSTGILEPKPQRALRNRTGLGSAAPGGIEQQVGGSEDEEEDASDDEGGLGQQQQQQQQQQLGARALPGMRAAQLVEPHNMKRLLWKVRAGGGFMHTHAVGVNVRQ